MHHNFLFDLDQTLLDFHASERIALEAVLRKAGLPFSEEICTAFREYNKALWLELEKGAVTRQELFEKRFRYVFGLCGAEDETPDPLRVNEAFIRTMSENGVLMDGALGFVRRLKAGIPGARIYIITNGAVVNATGRIASTGLKEYIDGLFVSEDMGVAKPDKAYFDICLREIGEPKETCAVIGDSLTSDMLGAKNAGLYSVWTMPQGDVESAAAKYGIGACVRSFDELYGVLERWAAGKG